MSEHYYPDPQLPTNSLAIASLVTGIFSYVAVPFLGALAAVITGHMAKNEIRANPGKYSGEGLATTGLILGYIHLGLIAFAIVLFIFALTMLPSFVDWFTGIIESVQ
jgi:hypothetical protein